MLLILNDDCVLTETWTRVWGLHKRKVY